MYKLIIRYFDGKTKKLEGKNILGFVNLARWYSDEREVKSVTIVDRTGFVYLHDSKMEGAKNQALRFVKAEV